MVKSNATIMDVAMLVSLFLCLLPCLEASAPMSALMMSPMGTPMMSPGTPMAMAPASDCMTALANVSDCLTFVQTGSNMTVPDKPCCPEFAGLLESNPICLCQLVGQAADYGVDIGRALMLPGICKLEVPSLDACPATPVPAPSPSSVSEAPGSTAGSPMADAGAALSPAGSGNSGSNGASSTAVHDFSTLICLAVAIFIAY